VIDREGAPLGVFSIDDVALKAQESASKNDVSYQDIVETCQRSTAACPRAENARQRGIFAPPVEAELWAPPLEVKHKSGNFIVTANCPYSRRKK
jgi:hypothetical protein